MLLPNGNIVKCGRFLAFLFDFTWFQMYWKRIEELRIDHDLTQQQVADILFCKREVYRRYEKGIRELPLSYAIILADYYDVTIDYIVERSNNKSNPANYRREKKKIR